MQCLDGAADRSGLGRALGIDADVLRNVLEYPEGAGVETALDAKRLGVLVVDHGVGSLVGL